MPDAGNLQFSDGITFISGHEAEGISCFCCGICCRKYTIGVSIDEALGIAANLEISWEEWLSTYTDPAKSGVEFLVLNRKDDACIFLVHDDELGIDICRIHNFKPEICRAWVSSLNQPDCREGLKKFWGLSVNPSGELEGSPEKQQAFFKLLKRLNG